MKNSFLILLVTLLGFVSFSFTTSPFGKARWEHLGSKKVNYRIDRDVIHVGIRERTFDKLKIQVSNGNLNMRKMIVEYANGSKDEISLRHNFSRGSESRIIDLKAGNRFIRDVTFWYDSKDFQRNRAVVHVYGRH
ncbi:MAG: hypothetical protein KDC80_15305 [Saprospiraceae bacterium]|nr:hypothetical protein [Saprospiraceae bacterium]